MTVLELIDQLGQFPADAQVVVEDATEPFVLERLELLPAYHVGARVKRCHGPGCPWCKASPETVQAVVL